MSLEQTIRDQIISEAADLSGRLDQLVRAGLMPSNILPVLHRAIAKVQGGMTLQGSERDAMNMFINSMMFIVLGDDSVFNKARVGAKGYATEETELDENAKIVAHLKKRYGDNIRKSHVMSAAKDFGVDASKLSKAVRKHLGKTMLEAKEKQEYDYEGDMAMSQLKSIIANSQRMHDSMSEDTNLPEWVQSKITLAEDYISTAANYLQGEMTEETQIDELSRATVGRYAQKAKSIADNEGGKDRTKGRELAGRKRWGGTMSGVKKAKVMATEESELEESLESMSDARVKYHATKNFPHGRYTDKEIKAEHERRRKSVPNYHAVKPSMNEEQIDELSKKTLGNYVKKAAGHAAGSAAATAAIASSSNPKVPEKTKRDLRNRMKGISKATDKMVKEDIDAVKKLNESYKIRFNAALEHYNIKSPSELGEEQRKEFFQFVDQEFKKGDN